ncbi:hypothetical protein LIER_31141 [Lithospermum erythrorhizon]|uniref:Uncharacterized protein n=1 Tax=Lithospermum erythrorhizon TaxID=34254 RepID=A0AAV3RSB2_LITER
MIPATWGCPGSQESHNGPYRCRRRRGGRCNLDTPAYFDLLRGVKALAGVRLVGAIVRNVIKEEDEVV